MTTMEEFVNQFTEYCDQFDIGDDDDDDFDNYQIITAIDTDSWIDCRWMPFGSIPF